MKQFTNTFLAYILLGDIIEILDKMEIRTLT